MKHSTKKVILTAFLAILFTINITAQKKEISKSFSGIKEVEVSTVLGGMLLQKSPDNQVHIKIVHNYTDNEFEVKFKEKGDRLDVEADLDIDDDSDGKYSKWTILVPSKTEVELKSGTGSITIEKIDIDVEGSTGTGKIEIAGCNGDFELSSGTGNVRVENCEGDFEVSSGTGTVRIFKSSGDFEASSGTGKVIVDNCTGSFEASSGTGNCKVSNITITEEAEIRSGTGDAEVTNPKGSQFKLEVSSGTGDAVLDLDSAPVEGYFEFTASQRKGRIVSPYSFDREEVYENGNDEKYDRKSFTKGKSTPKYYINTGTGTAELKK
jgi:hypothetical protein